MLQVANQFVDDPTRVVNRMTVAAPTQVNLQVRIAEVARNVDRQLGIRWNASSGIGNGGADRLHRRRRPCPRATTRSRVGLDPRLLQHRRAAAGAGRGGPRHHHGRAEPHRPLGRAGASFLAGGEFPYAVVNDDENTIAFKDFGIGLTFTPTVHRRQPDQPEGRDRGQRARLRHGPATMPSLNTRRAETTVDLASGQSFAIAGLMQNSSSQSATRRCRASARVPVLGALFRSNSFKRGQTELVIIVTPVIVQADDRPRHRDAGRPVRAAERLRAHPARPLPGLAQGEPGAEPHRQPPAHRPVRLRVRVRRHDDALALRPRRPSLAALVLAGCEAMPIGTFDRATTSSTRAMRPTRSTSRPTAPRSPPARRSGSSSYPADAGARAAARTSCSRSATPGRRCSTRGGCRPSTGPSPAPPPARVRVIVPHEQPEPDGRVERGAVDVWSLRPDRRRLPVADLARELTTPAAADRLLERGSTAPRWRPSSAT